MSLYFGKDQEKIDEKLSKSKNIVLRFLSTINRDNIYLFIDNYYMGPGLLQAISQKGICYLGTVRKSKLPSHVAHNAIKIYNNYRENNLLYILWDDRNTVKIMTNIYMLRNSLYLIRLFVIHTCST